MELPGIARLLIGAGLAITLGGLLLLAASRVPGLRELGRLPGDIVIERGSTTVFVPIVTSILVSVVLTVIVNIVFRR